MRIAFGTDERRPVTDALRSHLAEAGHEVIVVHEGDPWPDVGRDVGQAVVSGRADMGVVCCSTGTGVSIAANKVAGVRAALCGDGATAAGARRWNDANVVAIGLDNSSEAGAIGVVDAFLATDVDADEIATIATVEG